MKININYGNKVIVVPAVAQKAMANASADDARVLLAVLSGDGNVDASAVASSLGVDTDKVLASLKFWQSWGVIELLDSEKAEEIAEESVPEKVPSEPVKKKKVLRKSDEVPRYTTEELSDILEKRTDASHLVDECQQAFGKIFNTHEINVLLGLVDYLALSGEYVLELLSYCAKIGKHSLNYVERMAFSLIDEGIDNVAALKERIAELEVVRTNENFVRRLFGMKARALTSKEKKHIGQWFGKFGYGEEIVTKAYELTISGTNGDPSVPYANAILQRWFDEGLRTVEDIEKAAAARAESAKEASEEGSFDTDDFFEAALQRSYNKK